MMIRPEWLKSIFHCSSKDYLSNPTPTLGEQVVIRLEIAPDAPIEKLVIRTAPNGEQKFTTMSKSVLKGSNQTWEGQVTINEPLLHYRFGLQTEQTVWWFNAVGSSLDVPFDSFDFKLIADFQAIEWLPSTVFYQIFPDRFANGDRSNDPQDEHLVYRDMVRTTFDWGEVPPQGERNMLAFYGGDLPGIVQHIDYLTELGINALYLNPVFTGYSNHRYDVIDYENVDPVLGGNQALIELREALNQRNMRYILDIVPNHCGYGHSWFQKALSDPKTVEANFFYFDKHPNTYESWLGHLLLPKLNYASQELRQRMYLSEESVFNHWLKPPYLADGWRVDVANMLGRRDAEQMDGEVIPAIRKSVKTTNPDAYIVGENFFEAASQLQGNQWDAVMNYAGFCIPLWHWLFSYKQDAHGWDDELVVNTPWPTETLLKSWQDHLAAIPWQIALQQFNLLDSHDTPRIRTLLNGNDPLNRLAAVIQFSFPGVPCVYYGDEVGLQDEEGFGSRNCLPWSESSWNFELLDFYKRLIAFRKQSLALQQGSFRILYFDQDFFIFQRSFLKKHVLITANRSEKHYPAQRIDMAWLGFENDCEFEALFSKGLIRVKGQMLYLPDIKQGGEIWHLK